MVKDTVKARSCCESPTNQGYAPAQSSIAETYEYREGGLLKDEEGNPLLQITSRTRQYGSTICLGNLYADGNGIAVDRAKAAKWYRLAMLQ